MTKEEKSQAILKLLEAYFPNPEVPLLYKDPFTLLIAVILSAQCTDERVNKTTPELFALADTPWKMAALPQDTILQVIKPCGLAPAKSKAIQITSQRLVNEFGGQVPADMDALESLPGVGHKTASVVLCQAFGIPAMPVDTHIHRVAYRWGLSNGTNVKNTEADLKKLFPPSAWIKLHLQMILFARKYCPARGHIWTSCPVCSVYGVKSRVITN
jgi:endonuclease III